MKKGYGDIMKVNHSKDFTKVCKFSEIVGGECYLFDGILFQKMKAHEGYANAIKTECGSPWWTPDTRNVIPVHAFVNYRYMLNI